jgi:hypothetical protein
MAAVVRPFECGTVCLPQDNGFETLPLLSTNGLLWHELMGHHTSSPQARPGMPSEVPVLYCLRPRRMASPSYS